MNNQNKLSNRVKSSFLNIFSSLLGVILSIVIGFISRRFFILYLGEAILGVNTFFSSVVNILSLFEMGFSIAIVYSLYKPIALNNRYEIKSILAFYKKVYSLIGFLVLFFGFLISPFLPNIIKDDISLLLDGNPITFYTYYFIFLLNYVFSFFWIYKKSLILADQKDYLNNIIRYSFFTVLNILQIWFLVLFQNYFIFLLLNVLFRIIENLFVNYFSNFLYPWLAVKEIYPINKDIMINIKKNIKALIYHKLGGVASQTITSLFLSYFVGVIFLAKYSNYLLIVSSLTLFITRIFESITAIVGNYLVKESKEKSYSLYLIIFYANSWLSIYTSISLYFLINPFINIWLGSSFLINENIILIIVLTYFINTIRKSTLLFRDSMGLFWNDRFKPILEIILSIIFSYFGYKLFEIEGLFIGYILALILSSFWIEPFILFRVGFDKTFYIFIKILVKYILIYLFTFFITQLILRFFIFDNYLVEFIIIAIIILLISLSVLFLTSYKTNEFQFYMTIINSKTKRK